MLKPVSSRCALACRYCYYREPLVPAVGPPPGDVPAWLERFLAGLFDRAPGAVCMGWQGGEPLLAGLPYYRRVVALQARLARPGTVIDNDLQTSGVLVDDEWAAFLADWRFLVGISLDGPAALHDDARVDRAGRGTHARAMAGLERLRRQLPGLRVAVLQGLTQPGESLCAGVIVADGDIAQHHHRHPPETWLLFSQQAERSVHRPD